MEQRYATDPDQIPGFTTADLRDEREETRHLVVADRQAVISPSWSLHSGVGTAAYSCVWAMAGENQAFDGIDAAPVSHR